MVTVAAKLVPRITNHRRVIVEHVVVRNLHRARRMTVGTVRDAVTSAARLRVRRQRGCLVAVLKDPEKVAVAVG